MTSEQDRELRPAGRYEWEQIIRRSRLATVVAASGRVGKNGKPTKGGMSGTAFTGIALGWASYANDRGREIWPGDATVAVDLETSIATVRQVRKSLLRLGLLEFVCRRRGARGDEYRLTIPTDLLDVVEVLTPAQHKLAANRLREAARGKPGGSGGPPGGESVGSPPDHPAEPNGADAGWSGGLPEIGSGWSGGTTLGGPADTHTDHDRTTTTTDHSETDLRTAVTVAREAEAATDSDSDVGEVERAARAIGCPSHGPAFKPGRRPDGKPACPLCRRGAPASPNRIAPVIPINRHAREAS